MGALKKGMALLAWLGVILAACGGGVRTKYACSDLTSKPLGNQTVTIWDRGDGYMRLEDGSGKKLYECYCSLESMKSAAGAICSQGAVCRKGGSACSGSGDCCAGLVCTVGVCG